MEPKEVNKEIEIKESDTEDLADIIQGYKELRYSKSPITLNKLTNELIVTSAPQITTVSATTDPLDPRIHIDVSHTPYIYYSTGNKVEISSDSITTLYSSDKLRISAVRDSLIPSIISITTCLFDRIYYEERISEAAFTRGLQDDESPYELNLQNICDHVITKAREEFHKMIDKICEEVSS